MFKKWKEVTEGKSSSSGFVLAMHERKLLNNRENVFLWIHFTWLDRNLNKIIPFHAGRAELWANKQLLLSL